MRRTNVSRQKAMASTRRKSRAIAGRPSIGTPNPRPKPRTGGGMKLPTKRKVRPPRPQDTGGGMRPRRRPDPRRARAIAQQRNTRRGRR